ncbi:MAG TPA: CocE/NonD family hydrolase [Frankiaceae bacterium]|jgi:predicted acyl esterase|nr:CocE/NonD family hydrolase [Frankiaceae bacterium]
MRPRLALPLAALVAATALAAPAPAVEYGSLTQVYVVPTRHAYLHVEVAHPTVGGKVVRAAGVVTYSPYYGTLSTRLSDQAAWTRAGFARVSADLIGTGKSGGCYDYGGKRERESGYDLVEWIAKQPWSTGKVGMLGGSYDGTTAIQTASLRPPHLTTIIPMAAISRWYDYAYSGGIRYTANNEDPSDEGFDTPAAFSYGLSQPPPTDPDQPYYAERLVSAMTPCDETEHMEKGYAVNPDYDAFWVDRDYRRNAAQVTIPVLVGLNWGDWNVKQETGYEYWRALTRSPFKRLYAGTRWKGHGSPVTTDVRIAWMDHFLRGARNGVEKMPAVTSQTSDSAGAIEFLAGPVPRTTPVRLYAQEGVAGDFGQALLPSKPRNESDGVSYVPTGTATELAALENPRAPGQQWAWFESPSLKQDVRTFGAPTVQVWSEAQRTWLTYAVSVVDVAPDANVAVTRGWLDSRYRNTLAKRETWKPGLNGLTVVAKPTDYVFRKGHRVGLLVMAEQLDWVTAKAYDGAPGSATVTVDTTGRTSVTLPVVGRVDPRRLF